MLWQTTTGGRSWTAISPDLTRKEWEAPASVGKYRTIEAARPSRRGVIYAVAPSYLEAGRIWVGTDDGLIHVTADGGRTWTDVTPPDLTPWSKVSIIDASHFNALTAYAAINTFRLDDLRPHIYRTRDGGKTWSRVTNGIPDGAIVNVVREDPKRRGLLFAGTEREVYVSFNDGDDWQSLRLNMPATSIRDLIIKDDDLVVGTHGRSFWILDDITPLRQIDESVARSDVFLFRPSAALRVRWNANTDTPLPQEEPAGQNPPDGAILNYYLKSASAAAVTLEILDGTGRLVRRFSSDDPPEPPVEGRNIPDYWIRPPQVLSAAAGMHRFVWDLHYPPPAVLQFTYPIAAIYRNTPRVPLGPWVRPGRYTVKLTADGRTYTQPLTVKMDPRVRATPLALARQFTLSMRLYEALAENHAALQEVRRLRAELAARREQKAPPVSAEAIAALDRELAALEGTAGGFFGGGAAPPGSLR